MTKRQAQVYAPDLTDARPARPPPPGSSGVFLVIALAAVFGVLWMVYGAERPVKEVPAPSGPYKEAGPGAALSPDLPDREVFDVIEGREATQGPVTARPGPEQPLTLDALIAQTAEAPPAPAAGAGVPQGNGLFLAQLAALRSAEAADQFWRGLQQTAPAALAGATLDVERAEVGAGGVFFRVRAGYFPDRDEAGAFCDRIKALGRDCMVAAR